MITYNHEINDDCKVVLMWCIDIDDAVYVCEMNTMMVIRLVCYLYVMILLNYFSYLSVTEMYRRYEVNRSIYWQSFVYDFLMLYLCYTYVNIVSYDVTFR